MPPRFAYWTILIDNTPTAFRAHDQDELLPTFNQLRRKNENVVFKWFARGRLWDNPDQAAWAAKHLPPQREKRGRDWRPGGQHRDPRQRGPRQKSGSAPSGERGRTDHAARDQRTGPGQSKPARPPWQQPARRETGGLAPRNSKQNGKHLPAGDKTKGSPKPRPRSFAPAPSGETARSRQKHPGSRRPWDAQRASTPDRHRRPQHDSSATRGKPLPPLDDPRPREVAATPDDASKTPKPAGEE